MRNEDTKNKKKKKNENKEKCPCGIGRICFYKCLWLCHTYVLSSMLDCAMYISSFPKLSRLEHGAQKEREREKCVLHGKNIKT